MDADTEVGKPSPIRAVPRPAALRPSLAKWAGRAQAYAETFAQQCAHAIEPMLDALELAPGERLLDVGTGAGAVAAAAVARGAEVVASDPDPDMLALAAVAAPGARLVAAALPELDGIETGFDVVTANFVLNHVEDPGASVLRLAGVLREGGRLGVSIWPEVRGPLFSIWDEVVCEAGLGEHPSERLPPELDFPRTPEGLSRLLSTRGFSVRRAWLHEFEQHAEPDLWWSAAERGVAGVGQRYLAQPAEGRRKMRDAWTRVSVRHLGSDGRLHLRGTALLAVADRR